MMQVNRRTKLQTCWWQVAGVAAGAGGPPVGRGTIIWNSDGAPSSEPLPHLKTCCFSAYPVLLSSREHPDDCELPQVFSVDLLSSFVCSLLIKTKPKTEKQVTPLVSDEATGCKFKLLPHETKSHKDPLFKGDNFLSIFFLRSR